MLAAVGKFTLEATRHPQWRRLEGLIREYRSGAITRHTALKDSHAPLRALMHRPGMAEGIDSAAIDDVVQDMLIAFDSDILDGYDDAYPLKPLVDAWMIRIRKNYWRKIHRELPWTDFRAGGNKESGMYSADNERGGGDDSMSHHRVQMAVDEGLMGEGHSEVPDYDMDVAMQEFTTLMQRHGAPSDTMAKKPETPTSKPSKPVLSAEPVDDRFADHDELKRIQTRLGLNREAFAARLGIGKSRLASYLYHAVLSVPADVVARARELEQGEAEQVDEMRELYARPMTEILQEWRNRYGLPSDEQGMARVLGVTVTTIRRWYKAAIRPGIDSIREYERKARAAKPKNWRVKKNKKQSQ